MKNETRQVNEKFCEFRKGAYRDSLKKGDKIGMVLFTYIYMHNYGVVSEITLANKLSDFGTTS